MSRSENGAAALELAAAGHPVLPLHTPTCYGCSCGRSNCGRPGKHPRGFYGLKSASTDPERVKWWWHGQPSANIGMRCDGLVVFDLDGLDGRHSLDKLESELGELPETRGQCSGRGEHRFYSTPGVDSIGNSTSPLSDPPGLDLRAGTRGYVVVAPSLHASGPRYRWTNPEAPIARLPQLWLERLNETSASLPAMAGYPPVWAGSSTRYGLVALRDELKKVRSAPEGSRNNTLNRSVFKLAQLAAGGELEIELIESRAHRAAHTIGLDWLEAHLTIASALNAGWAYPRSRKPRE
jgi:hypothetical protein